MIDYCPFDDNNILIDKNTGWLSKYEVFQVILTKYFVNTYKDADNMSGFTFLHNHVSSLRGWF